MGLMLFTGELSSLNIKAQEWLDGLGLNFFKIRLDTCTVWLIVVGWIRHVSGTCPARSA